MPDEPEIQPTVIMRLTFFENFVRRFEDHQVYPVIAMRPAAEIALTWVDFVGRYADDPQSKIVRLPQDQE